MTLVSSAFKAVMTLVISACKVAITFAISACQVAVTLVASACKVRIFVLLDFAIGASSKRCIWFCSHFCKTKNPNSAEVLPIMYRYL